MPNACSSPDCSRETPLAKSKRALAISRRRNHDRADRASDACQRQQDSVMLRQLLYVHMSMRTVSQLRTVKGNTQSRIEAELERTGGLLRLAPTWVPRSFLQPGLRLKLHPDDTYAYGARSEEYTSELQSHSFIS